MQIHEIEIQVQVESSEKLLSFLNAEGEFQSENHQVDEYFVPAHKNFLAETPIKEWLRLRSAADKYSINYKNWHFDEHNNGTFADEYETSVGNVEITKRILTSVGMRPIITVDKVRKTWQWQDYEIAMDTVKGLGDFVEVEYKGARDAVEHKEIMASMIQFLKDQGCGSLLLNHTGYPALLLGRKEKQEVL